MSSNILFLNGPNLNLLGQREQSQYGSITYEELKKKCEEKCKELDLKVEFIQSNVEGEMVSIIQSANEKFEGIIINAAAFTHTSVAIRDALEIFKKKLVYRAAYRGTKEMDILLGSFVNKNIDSFNKNQLIELDKFLNFEDEIILNFYHHNIVENQIDKNIISLIFKNFKL